MAQAANAAIERIRNKMTDMGKDIKRGGSKTIIYFVPGQRPVSFKSQKDVVCYMDLKSHKQVPKMITFGEAEATTSAMKRNNHNG